MFLFNNYKWCSPLECYCSWPDELYYWCPRESKPITNPFSLSNCCELTSQRAWCCLFQAKKIVTHCLYALMHIAERMTSVGAWSACANHQTLISLPLVIEQDFKRGETYRKWHNVTQQSSKKQISLEEIMHTLSFGEKYVLFLRFTDTRSL